MIFSESMFDTEKSQFVKNMSHILTNSKVTHFIGTSR